MQVGPYNNREILRDHMGPKHASFVSGIGLCECLDSGAMKNTYPST